MLLANLEMVRYYYFLLRLRCAPGYEGQARNHPPQATKTGRTDSFDRFDHIQIHKRCIDTLSYLSNKASLRCLFVTYALQAALIILRDHDQQLQAPRY